MDQYHILLIIVVALVTAWAAIAGRRLRAERNRLAIELARSGQYAESLEAEMAREKIRYQQEWERLRAERKEERERLAEAERALERADAFSRAQLERLTAQKAEIEQVRTLFNKDFELIANRILEEKTQKFTETNHKNLDQLLSPLKENIRSFEEKVDKVYKAESDERNTLKGVVEVLVEQSKQIQHEANSLTRALKGDSKKQGNWGEVILERVLERSGLVKDREYRLQASLQTEDGRRLQPDAIIDLPDEKHLVIDSKVSLVAYERWINAENEDEKVAFARQHVASVRSHVLGLSAKNYHDLYQINSPDFVLLFMPIESAFGMAATYHGDLFSEAWERRVVIVSPSTLLATLRTIASMWKQERQNRNVLDIAREAGALYDKFAGLTEDFEKMERQIGLLSKTHEEARKKLDTGRGNLVSRVERLKQLGAKANKQVNSRYLNDKPDDDLTV